MPKNKPHFARILVTILLAAFFVGDFIASCSWIEAELFGAEIAFVGLFVSAVIAAALWTVPIGRWIRRKITNLPLAIMAIALTALLLQGIALSIWYVGAMASWRCVRWSF